MFKYFHIRSLIIIYLAVLRNLLLLGLEDRFAKEAF